MKSYLKLIFAFFLGNTLNAQIFTSTCDINDTIAYRYKNDADRLAIRRVYKVNNSYKDSIAIDEQLSERYLKPLLAVFNATNIPARDTVVAWLKIHTNSTPQLRDFGIGADSNLIWMKNLRNNIIPCGQPMIDGAITKYGFVKKKFLAYPAIPWHIVVFDAGANINTLPLGVKFTYSVPGVYFAGEHENAWDGSDIVDSVSQNFIELKYSYKWGDCIDGCDYEHYWTFRVYNDCSVQYMGNSGSALPPWASINEQSKALQNVKISPNPASDLLKVDIQSSTAAKVGLQIIDLLGECIKDLKIESDSININISEISQGAYFLKLMGKDEVKTIKFIKE